jgi:hypothetical protein
MNKELKVKHQTIALAFADKVKEHPPKKFESKNYDRTFMNFCEENDQNLHKKMIF